METPAAESVGQEKGGRPEKLVAQLTVEQAFRAVAGRRREEGLPDEMAGDRERNSPLVEIAQRLVERTPVGDWRPHGGERITLEL
jgi:hypothetical protein